MHRATASLLVIGIAAIMGAGAVQAQSLNGVTLVSPNPGDRGAFGRSVAGVPDADGDGRGDLLIGAFNEDGGASEAGRAYLFSGADATIRLTLVSPNPEQRGLFGAASAGVPDADGDGFGDLLIGAPGETDAATKNGRAYLFSGATGMLLATLISPNPVDFGGFGTSVSGVPDADGDGRGDLLIGASAEDGGATDSGRAYLFSGATGALLASLTSPNAVEDGTFGTSVSGVPDADGDGRGDLLVGAETENGGADGSGRAYLFSGATGALLASLVNPTPTPFTQFGNSVSGVADADGDGRGDLLVGAVTAGADFHGRAFLYSGATGALLFSFVSPNPSASNFGRSVSGVPDVNGDGRGDVLIGESLSDRTHLYDGATGTLLATVLSLVSGQNGQFGDAVAGVPDVDGDGRGDFLVGAFAQQVGATTTDGRAFLFYAGFGTPSEPGAPASAVTLHADPNPAAGRMTVTLAVDAPQWFVVGVYDALGRRVAVFHNGPLAIGRHTFSLDVSSQPPGVYMVRLEAIGETRTQRVTIVR